MAKLQGGQSPPPIEVTLAELARFGGTMPQGDDITMVLVRRS